MSAPLRDVLVKRPGRRSGAPSTTRPTGSSTRSTSTSPGASTTGFVDDADARSAPTGPRARRRDRRSRSRLHLRPAARDRPRRDPAPPRQAEPRAASRPSLEAWTRPRGIPTLGRIEAPGHASRAATRSGCGRTCCASGGRCGRTRRAPASSRRSSVATCASSTSRTGRARRSSSTCCRSSRRSPTISRSSTCRCCRSGCGRCSASSGIRLVEVPDEEFPTLGCNVLAVRPGRRHRGRGQRTDPAAPGPPGCEVHAIPRARSARTARAGSPA